MLCTLCTREIAVQKVADTKDVSVQTDYLTLSPKSIAENTMWCENGDVELVAACSCYGEESDKGDLLVL